METSTLLKFGFFSLNNAREPTNPRHFPLPRRVASPLIRIQFGKRSNLSASAVFRSSIPEDEFCGEDIIRSFLQERQLNGDFVSRLTDMLSKGNDIEVADLENNNFQRDGQQNQEAIGNETDNGLLKLTKTRDLLSGYSAARIRKKAVAKNESDKRKKLNFLKYQALKRELMLLTVGIGAACSVYCLLTLSFQAAASYASGVAFSCLYLQLLFSHTDNISKDSIPEIFLRKNTKKIGIRSEDLRNAFEKSLNGTTIALSSPRLVTLAAIYGLWALLQHFASDFLDFQLVPGVVGFFAYKAAALVQVYRDNEGLSLVFPENDV